MMLSKSGKMWMALAGLALAGCGGRIDGDDVFFGDEMSLTDDRVVVQAQTAPPPISGGTLIVSRDGRTAIASDPDHDVVWRVDLDGRLSGPNAGPILSATALEPGDQPGRLVEDQRGWIHVVLRGGGAIATIDPARAQNVTRTAVCPEPRGLAYDDIADVLHVACTNGALVTLVAATPGDEVRRVQLDDDLRDVVVRHGADGNSLLVSRFRSAEVLELAGDGSLSFRYRLPSTERFQFTERGEEVAVQTPGAAWRTVALQDGTVQVIHQRGTTGEVSIEPSQPGGGGGYGGGGFDGCAPAIVQAAGTSIDPESGEVATSLSYARVVLPVDVAVSSDGRQMAVASAATRSVVVEARPSADDELFDDGCSQQSARAEYPMTLLGEQFSNETQGRQPVAVAYRARDGVDDELFVQVRDPAAIVNLSTNRVFMLPAAAVSDSGHQTFHEAASVSGGDFVEFSGLGAELACASCHMEGREDGRIWNFSQIGARRTQNVAGGILGTEPFHWSGDMTHFDTLMDDVFVGRMAGAKPSRERMSTVSHWLDTVPAARIGLVVDDASVERGRALFEDQDVGCAGCHTGAKLTNNRTVDVGTGGSFQVPSLVGVSARAPYLHDGRAATLRDRFGYGGGGDRHGHTSQLDADQISDLVAYLETL